LSARDAYAGLADPTRRGILSLLRDEGALIAGDIAAAFPRVSRPAISRHVRVLKDCGLVTSQRRGKTLVYRVDPQPLRDIRDGWLASFADMQTDSLARLRLRVERRQVERRPVERPRGKRRRGD
jgi:DNA-binding transcriptional ArsR family regulator